MRSVRYARLICGLAAAALLFGPQASAQTLSSDLSPIGFIVGNWVSDSGHAENEQKSRGRSSIEPAAGGSALLRRDKTEVLDSKGQVSLSFQQVMLIYPEGGRLRADYFDGTHAIHYVDADVTPGQLVRFRTAPAPSAPMFQLTYEQKPDGGLGIRFEMKPPGQSEFRTIAEGTAKRVPNTH